MQSTKDLREARRKRILERGSDRLAYIAGGSKQPLKRAPLSEEESSLILNEGQPQEPPKHAPLSEEESSSILNEDGSERVFHQTQVVGSEVIGCSEEASTNSFVARSPDKTGISSQALFNGVDRGVELQLLDVKLLTESINKSQRIRVLMATIIAIMTVTQSLLSSSGNPWGDVLSFWSIGWPVALLLLTNISIFVMVLIFQQTLHYKHNTSAVNGVSEDVIGNRNKLAAINVLGQFERYFNFGLLLKQMISAILLDFSIYAVIVVSGLDLGNHFFPH